MAEVERIGVLTSGGDAPGMNAAIRSVVRGAINKGYEVIGFIRGYNGLINDDYVELTRKSVADVIHRGGTVLYTARCSAFRTVEGRAQAAQVCKKHNLKGLVVIGGDGTFAGALQLSKEHGINVIGIPATIDNDIACTDYTLGFDSAVNNAVEMIDKIRDTSQSHDRCTVVEVMGRNAGHIALDTGLATGATSILVPEIEYDLELDIVQRIKRAMETGKKHFIIIVAEGVGGSHEIAKFIENRFKIESRASVLGYVQRGGNPTSRDRIMACHMGCKAVDLIHQGLADRVVVSKGSELSHMDITEALAMKKTISEEIYHFHGSIN